MYIGLHVKYQLCLSEFNETRILSIDFRRIFKYQLYVQREPSCFMLTEGRADMTKVIVAFRSFANAPERQHM
jgi:hypothetical protein